MTSLLIRNSFLLAKAEDAYGVLGSAIANTDAQDHIDGDQPDHRY
jgi:hypothetical protein